MVLQIFFSILNGEKSFQKVAETLSLPYSILNDFYKVKNISLFLRFDCQLFAFGHNQDVFSTLVKVAKVDFENDKVVSTLLNIFNIKVETYIVDSTLFNVVNLNVDVHNIVTKSI